MHALRENRDIVIAKADKGDAIVIMNTAHLVELAHVHLSDRATYQLLKQDPTPDTVMRFNQYLDNCRNRKAITEAQF